MQPNGPSARRLAVALHNRKHPIPTGVYVVLGILVLGGALILYASTRQNPETTQLRQELQRTHQELRQDIQISEWEQANPGSCGECFGTGKIRLESSRISCPRCQGTGKRR